MVNGSETAAERGQLVVVTALLIATVLVGLALVVNSAIYAENVSTRETADSSDAALAADSALGAFDTFVDRANAEHNGSHDDVNDVYVAQVDHWRAGASERRASQGTSFGATVADRTNGTYIRQTDDTRDFTNATGTENWTLAAGVGGISDYRIDVNGGLQAGMDGSFVLNVTDDDGTTWKLHVYDDGSGNAVVHAVLDDGTEYDCTATGSSVEIDLVDGTLDGDECDALTFAEGLEGDVDVGYGNPDAIVGTYDLRVDRKIDPSTDDSYEEFGVGSPAAAAILYSADLDVSYERDDLAKEQTVRAVAGDEVYAG